MVILLLICLMACSQIPQQITKTEYIEKTIPYIPEKPEYYKVNFIKKDNLYCVDEVNAKNLLKNKVLLDNYTKELEDILIELKGE